MNPNPVATKLAFEIADLRRRIASLELKAALPPAGISDRGLYVATCERLIADLQPILALREGQLVGLLFEQSQREDASSAQFSLCFG